MHERWAQKMTRESNPRWTDAEFIARIAERERRRIRRAQRDALASLRNNLSTELEPWAHRRLDQLDAATRAPRMGKR